MAEKENLKFTPEHEWLEINGDTVTVGITDFAADKLGDVVFVELPKVGAIVHSGKVVGEIESTKSVGELFAPVDGTVLEANSEVAGRPELVNEDPFGSGWLIKVQVADVAALESAELLDFAAYTALVGE